MIKIDLQKFESVIWTDSSKNFSHQKLQKLDKVINLQRRKQTLVVLQVDNVPSCPVRRHPKSI